MSRAGERAAQAVLFLCALAAVALLLLLTAFFLSSGLPAIREIGWKEFLLGRVWDSADRAAPQFGILPLLLASIYGAAGAAALAVPLGLPAP